ncbi:MAG TPA: hypothetical protein VGC31_08700, partial [Paenirhodobacter sp.]
MTSPDTDPRPATPPRSHGRPTRSPAPLRTHQARTVGRFGAIGPVETIAFGLSAVWLLLTLAFWLFVPSPGISPASVISGLVGVVLPLVLIWVAALSVRTAQELRQDARQMKATIEALRA